MRLFTPPKISACHAQRKGDKQRPTVLSEPYFASKALRRFRVFGAVLATSFLLLAPRPAAATEAKNVLVLYSHNRVLPALVEAERGLRETLINSADRPIEFFIESLDVPRFTGDAYTQLVAAFLREKYAARPPDLIVAVSEESLAF